MLSDGHTSKQEVLDGLQAKLKECQNDNNRLNQKIDELQNQLLSSQNKKQALENQNAQFISEIQQLEDEVKIAQCELQKKNEELLGHHRSERREERFGSGQVVIENENYNECMALFISINKILQKEMSLTRSLACYFENQYVQNQHNSLPKGTSTATGKEEPSQINDTFGK